jgi:hypothetical protein
MLNYVFLSFILLSCVVFVYRRDVYMVRRILVTCALVAIMCTYIYIQVYKIEVTIGGTRCADHVTPSIC